MKNQSSYYSWRFLFIAALLVAGVVTLIVRLINLQILSKEFLQDQGDARAQRVVKLPAYRGNVVDRNDEPLAVSTPVVAIWAVPKEVLAGKKSLQRIAVLLNTKPDILQKRLQQHVQRSFFYLKRQVTPTLAAKVEALGMPGVYLTREYRRYYPMGEVTSHVVGFTNIDDQGQEGLELAFDEWLRGRPGQKIVVKDRKGQVIDDVESIREPKSGKTLTLSLDKRIQYLAYRELKRMVTLRKAKAGSLVMLDVNTGEVLAMVNQPAYNPNNRADLIPSKLRNRAVTDLFEPGSVIKPFSVAAALESGKFTPTSVIDTAPGVMSINKNLVRDLHNYGKLNLTSIITKSSNVGISKVILSLPKGALRDMLVRFGFGTLTGSGFPGETSGTLADQKPLDDFTRATQSFGYALSMNALQLVHAYAMLAAGGIDHGVHFLRQAEARPGKRILDAKIARQLLHILETVLSAEGTGKRARVPGYRVAGKTGTVEVLGSNGYEKHRHIGLFAGITPVERPRLAMVVVIYEPQGTAYFGGLNAAPVFAKVMAGALRLLNIPPDGLVASVKTSLKEAA